MKLPLALIIPVLGFCWRAPAPAQSQDIIKPGDHVAFVGNSFADMMRKHGYFETLLLQRLGELSFRNLGWAGDTLSVRQRPTNFPTEDQTLTKHQTDVVLICFGMGESFDGEDGLAAFRTDLTKLVTHYQSQKYNGESPPRLTLISPIAYEDLGEITPDPERRNADLASYTGAIKQIAENHDIPFIDLFAPTAALMAEDGTPALTVNGIRPNTYGYWVVSLLLADAFAPAKAHLLIDVDPGAKPPVTGAAPGFRFDSIEAIDGGLQLKVEESGWVTPPPPVGSPETQTHFARDRLAVQDLPAAYYTLTVDGEPVATATHEEWAEGVVIDTSPAHREAEKFRSAVIDKNEQFFHSWRALNQVHIVGERKKSPSGRALPGELVEFSRIAEQRDRILRGTDPPQKKRVWKLVANPEKKLP